MSHSCTSTWTTRRRGSSRPKSEASARRSRTLKVPLEERPFVCFSLALHMHIAPFLGQDCKPRISGLLCTFDSCHLYTHYYRQAISLYNHRNSHPTNIH